MEKRILMGWYLKYDAVRQELEISERLGEKVVGIKLLISVRQDGTLTYEESMKIGRAHV